MENEANLLLPFGILKLKGFKHKGVFPLTSGSALSMLGAPSQTPIIGSPCVHPTFVDLASPVNATFS